MTNFTSWLSPELLRPLGWTLLHFLWQGAALAALLAVLLSIFRTASGRYVLAVATLVLMMAAPVITFAWLLERGASDSAPAAAQGQAHTAFVASRNLAAMAPVNVSPASEPAPQAGALLALVELWFVGVLFLSLRTAGGLFLLEKMRRKDTRPVTRELYEKCIELQRRIGVERFIHYCECAALDAPAVIGWIRPIVLLPATALTGLTEAQIEAVIAHELAHIRRFDGFVNLFQIAVETLLFYHPAVWWVSRRIRLERENCCDDAAISIHGDAVDYARALTLMEHWRTAPALAMAANRGPLSARIFRLLSRGNSASGTRVAGLAAGLLCLSAALLAGNACLGVAHASLRSILHSNQDPGVTHEIIVTPEADADQAPMPATASAQVPVAVPAPVATPAIARAPSPAPHPTSIAIPAVSVHLYGALRSVLAGLQNPSDNGSAPAHSYLENMESAGFKNLTVDQLIAMKVQGITPEYVKSMQSLGFKPDVDELVAMKVQGITPEYVKEIRGVWPNVDADQLIGIKVQGVTPEYVKSMESFGFKPGPDDIIALKVQGITPEYVKEIRATWPNVDMDQLIAIKVQGVTPQYVREISDLGFKPNADDIVGLKVQGVTAAYIKSLQSSGLGALKLEDIIGAKVMGITPEFIANAQQHGFKNLSLDKLIALKNADVL
jgi:beta-lactamase regulating signal transducer with metallopeptidase domain